MNPMAMKFGGVRIPEDQRRGGEQRSDKPTGTVVQLIVMRVCGVGIVDENGRIVSTVAYKIGNQWWTDPNGAEWVDTLLRAGPKLSENLEGALEEAEETRTAPSKPAEAKKVNVTASRIDARTQQFSEAAKV